jgi:hypothetical protein
LFQAVRIPQEDTNYISGGDGYDDEEEEVQEEEEQEVCDTVQLETKHCCVHEVGRSLFKYICSRVT